jgi:hypothetical protein
VRNHRHGVEEVGQQLLVPRAHPRCPHRLRWRRQGRREDRTDLLRRKTVGESIGGRPRCPCCWRWRHQGRRKGRASVLRRKTIGESAGKHGRRERLLDVDPPPRNQATSERCQSRGRGRGATRCSRRGRERRWWWCRCRSHHGRFGHCRREFRSCRAAGATVVASGRRQPLEVVAQHTKGRRSSPEKRHSSPGRRHNRGRVGSGRQTPKVWE